MAEQPLTGDDPPAWVVESVHLSAYDPGWPARAARYAGELHGVLDQWLLGPIEHVGSTSVPGLTAKPVIDLMAQAADPDAAVGPATGPLAELGWRYVPPELDGRPFRRFFAKVTADGQHRLAHLHLMFPGAARWDQQLRFRDALRADAALRDDYASEKGRLARAHPGDRERYTDEKARFVTRTLRALGAAS
jgi:GrpB-like predicted nucleotidyltransferase (UPF0157 family)